MPITTEQADQAKQIIFECLNASHGHRVPFQEVWTKSTQDFDGAPYIDVWAFYDDEPHNLDIRLLNSLDTQVMQALRQVGIHAIPSISYVPQSEADQIGEPWTG